MSKKEFVEEFGRFRIYREGLGHFVAYNKFNGEFEISGDTLQEVENDLTNNED